MPGRLGLGLGLLAAAGLSAAAVERAWPNLDLATPVVGAVSVAGGAVTPARGAPPSVLLVVIDGLRADVAGTLPFLSRLAEAGARARTWVDAPTISSAQFVALLAGVPPRDSGVRNNEALRPAGVDDVALRARAAGLRTAVRSTCVDWWQRLFPASFESAAVIGESEVESEVARLAPGGGLLIVHLCGVDDAGHAFGARSPAYATAAASADRLAARAAAAWGWPRANVVVTADHGHRDRGGHGGDEPEVRRSFLIAAGPDVEPGARVEDARAVDVAPTLAALLGVASPATASGRTLAELLRAPSLRRAALVAADVGRQTRVAAAAEPVRAAAASRQRNGRFLRLSAIAVLIALLLTRVRGSRRAFPWRGFGRGLIALVATLAAFVVVFGPPSFSAARRGVIWVAALGAIAFLAATIALWLGARRGEAAATLLAVIAALGLPALLAFVHAGMFAARLDCEPAWLAAGPAWAYTVLAAACMAGAARCLSLARPTPREQTKT